MSNPQSQLMIHTDGSADDLFRLKEWLNGTDELRGRVTLPTSRIRPGEMGGLTDVLVVAVGAGGIAPVLIQSLTGWLTARRSDITLTLKTGEHTEITVDLKRIKQPEVTKTLQSMLERFDNRQ
ncbi:effector-associated constant component EACC1 [Nocardia sp. IBHARD005]|uniref:effector-associated constant component EACC1 n=1 Tax=Nocardia sp. IBHARD005 TaxID=3457765 RepID=UPI0040594FAD